jgi:hypothetical protein
MKPNIPVKWIFSAAVLTALAACGGDIQNERADAIQTESTRPEAPSDTAGLPADYRKIEVRVGTAQEVRFKAENEELLRLAGGCDGKTPMSIGFQNGELYQASWRYFSFDSDGPVSVRQMGDIPLSKVTWDDGVVPNEKLNMNMPDRYEGPGMLTITRHEASLKGRRMEGQVNATLTNKDGNALLLNASFSVPLGCWSMGLD